MDELAPRVQELKVEEEALGKALQALNNTEYALIRTSLAEKTKESIPLSNKNKANILERDKRRRMGNSSTTQKKKGEIVAERAIVPHPSTSRSVTQRNIGQPAPQLADPRAQAVKDRLSKRVAAQQAQPAQPAQRVQRVQPAQQAQTAKQKKGGTRIRRVTRKKRSIS